MARHLYNKGFIPDEDLMFFMQIDEIERLVTTRNTQIIARAMRRRQIFAELEQNHYQYIIQGIPEPINKKGLEQIATTTVLMGTSVCEGRVIEKARVVTLVDDAKNIQPGKILIARNIDIFWTPFFPIVKGIVTEIGGLLSHGCVVAREYGLPSLICVQQATSLFKTGDLIELDFFNGTISKVIL